MGLVPAGAHSNRKFFGSWSTISDDVPSYLSDLMFDPQTSGGLILGVPPSKADELIAALSERGVAPAAEIGEVVDAEADGHLEIA